MRLGVARIQAWPHARPRSTITYLAHPRAYALGPGLPLSSAPRQTAAALTMFGAFSDCAPDRWGRRLVQRAEHDRAAADHDAERSIGEMDFLRRVRDDLPPRRAALPRSRLDGIPGSRIAIAKFASLSSDR